MKWKTKSVLYDYKLNQCFAFFLICTNLECYQFNHFFNNIFVS